MIPNMLKQFNWVDILIILIFLRICLVALRTGFPAEACKLLGVIVALYLSLHYFAHLSDWFMKRIPQGEERIPLAFLDFVSFLALASVGYVLVFLIRVLFDRYIKMEAAAAFNKWGGFALGTFRAALLVSLVSFGFFVSTISYLSKSVRGSFFGAQSVSFAASTYSWIWDSVTSKFMAGEKFNAAVVEVQGQLRSDK